MQLKEEFSSVIIIYKEEMFHVNDLADQAWYTTHSIVCSSNYGFRLPLWEISSNLVYKYLSTLTFPDIEYI
jgi:hypothetical protein